MIELPPDFPHKAPKGYSYEVTQFKANIIAIWTLNHGTFSYTEKVPKSIWGFYNTKTRFYSSPINSTKCGNSVDIRETSPYSAIIPNLTPLQKAFL